LPNFSSYKITFFNQRLAKKSAKGITVCAVQSALKFSASAKQGEQFFFYRKLCLFLLKYFEFVCSSTLISLIRRVVVDLE